MKATLVLHGCIACLSALVYATASLTPVCANAGPAYVLAAAEKLVFTSMLAGFAVLGLQVIMQLDFANMLCA